MFSGFSGAASLFPPSVQRLKISRLVSNQAIAQRNNPTALLTGELLLTQLFFQTKLFIIPH
jgi:hypothetical protein